MGKFAWANFNFISPPPEWLVGLMVPDEFNTRKKRRMLQEAVAAGEDGAEEEKPPSDLPDPNESGNAGFLRKMGVSADEFFIGLILGVLLTPMFTALVHVPAGRKAEQIKNALRMKIIAKQEQCKTKNNFAKFVPEFDPVLAAMPKWTVPTKFALSTVLMTVFMLQNMGIMQASLLGFFEHTAITTKIAALVAFVMFPCGFIVYLFVTLKGAMVPTSICRTWSVNYLKSIPEAMTPDSLVFVYSIPPELREKVKLEPPVIPEGASPDEIKEIMQKHVGLVKEMVENRTKSIKALGPAALMETGKWKTTSKVAEAWFQKWGAQMAACVTKTRICTT